jgi:hypothetical protein
MPSFFSNWNPWVTSCELLPAPHNSKVDEGSTVTQKLSCRGSTLFNWKPSSIKQTQSKFLPSYNHLSKTLFKKAGTWELGRKLAPHTHLPTAWDFICTRVEFWFMMTAMEMPGTTESQNASTSEDISVCCLSWTVRSDHNKNSGTSIINHHLHVHIDRNSWILINLHRKSKMNLQEVTPFTESWNVFNLVTHFERHDQKNYFQVCMQCEITVRLIRPQISMWIFNVQFEITWLMYQGISSNLNSKGHERDSVSTCTFTEPISLISLQEWFSLWNVNARAYLIGCHPFEQTLHHIIPDN